jgi:integrase
MNAFERLGIDGRPVSGHAFLIQRARGPQWYVKFRLPDGRQVQRRLALAWTGRGRPATGYLTRRSAQAVLDELLAQARAGTLPGMVRTGATFAQASAEWLRWQEFDRQRKRSTVDDYRSAVRVHLDPAFAHLQLEEITPRLVDQWRQSLVDERRLSNRSVNKLLVLLHGVLERARKVWGLRENPVRDVERQPLTRRAHIDVYSTKEIRALVRRRRIEARRRNLSRRRLHRAPHRRAARAALARLRPASPDDSRQRQLQPPPAHHPEVRQGTRGPHD